jgi:hypothetical protein
MKKLISVIALVALLITSLAIFASCGAQQSVASVEPTVFENVKWSYNNETKTLSIVSNSNEAVPILPEGKTISINNGTPLNNQLPWYKLRAYIAKIELTKISKINDYAFYNLYRVESVSFGEDLTSIGKSAFAFCTALACKLENKNYVAGELTLPEGVTSIGSSAFEACTYIKKINLPSTVTSVGERAFASANSLKEVSLNSDYLSTLSDDAKMSLFAKDSLDVIPTLTPVAPAAPETESGESTETEAPAESESATETEKETEKATEKETEKETEAPKPTNKTTTILAIVVLALVLIGIIVGAILLVRSNKKQTNDSRTVRKDKDDPKAKKAKAAKNNKKKK